MKKIIIGIVCLIVISSFMACHKITKSEDGIDNTTPGIEEKDNISDDAEEPKVTASISDEQIFTVKSEDESIIIDVTTINDMYENRIKEISIINNGVTLNTIDTIIGYYDGVTIDTAASLALIEYHGRKWIDFALLDITNGQIAYMASFTLEDVKSVYRNNGMMNYEINEDDVIAFYCDKIIDNDSIIISYQVRDTNDNLQSGNFEYILSKREFKNMQDNSHSVQAQIKIIADHIDLWAVSMDYANDQYNYAVTDLDDNKRLEIIASNIGGTGIYTYSSFYEINENFDGLVKCETSFTEGDSEADIAADSIPGYYDPKANIMYYIFDDIIKNGAAEYYENKRAVYLDNGMIKEIPLAYKSIIYTSSTAKTTYQDAEQNKISKDDYNMIADKVFADLEKKNVSFGWQTFHKPEDLKNMSSEQLMDMLIKSYEEFIIVTPR